VPTIYDVAARAGVSIKTVSRVVNAEANVAAKTRDRVMAAVAALDYHPNLSARSLAGSRSFLIAAVVDEKLTLDHWRTGHGTDYLARIQLGATMACREAGYHLLVVLVDHGTPLGRQQLTTMLATLKPDGVILTPPSADSEMVLGVLRRSGTSYVRLGPESGDGGGLRLNLDDREAARGVTDYLLALGHRRIGFIGGDERYGSSGARRDGFLAAMAARGLKTPWLGQGDYTFQSGVACGRAMLARARRPSAIFAGNDEMALGCMAAATACGLRVPDDVSVAGFDDSGGSRLSVPPLTTVRQPIEDMAALAARALIDGSVRPESDLQGGGALPGFTLMARLSTAGVGG
jgi:LacI family transcriptional regulator